jgi:hypothetical protein
MGRLGAMEDFMAALHASLVELVVEVGRRRGGTFGWKNDAQAQPQVAFTEDKAGNGKVCLVRRGRCALFVGGCWCMHA